MGLSVISKLLVKVGCFFPTELTRNGTQCNFSLYLTVAFWMVLVRGDPCTSLYRVFCATGSRITHVPEDIPPNTVSVYLHDNRIQIIKTLDFSSLIVCAVLDLHGNRINVIEPAAFYRLNNLEELDLSGNRLTLIWANMFLGLFSLEELSLDGNSIKTIDDGVFGGLHMLKNLSLKYNEIKAVTSETFRDLVSLENLLLTNNKLTRLGQCALSDVLRLSNLDLSSNYFDCDGEMCWLVEEVRQRALTLLPPYCRSPRTWYNLDCHGPGKVFPLICNYTKFIDVALQFQSVYVIIGPDEGGF